jgi:hypothetical protein
LRSSYSLPLAGGPGQLAGDLVWTPSGAAAVYAKPVGNEMQLAFYRFDPDARTIVERVHSLAPWPCYEPGLAYDGQAFGIALSSLTQASFLLVAPSGDILSGPVQLPGLPSGAQAGRTAAFKVIWTGQGFAVFGLWLEREFPLQELTQGNFYTHLRYWLVNSQGQTLAQKELRTLAPLSYPGTEGAERNYYDVAWTGQAFFVTYYGESQNGPPLSVYYQLFDLAGGSLRPESPLLAAQVAQGPKLAWSGQAVAATALKTISLPNPAAGNYMYLRCFAADGAPLAVETSYGQKLGYGPIVSWVGDRFLTAYCVMYDMATLGYSLMFTAFDEQGRVMGAEQPLRNAKGSVITGRLALGVDLQVVGQGNVLYCKAQNSDAFAIQTTPLWFTLNNDFVISPTLKIVAQGDRMVLGWTADAAPFQLQESPRLFSPQWTDVPTLPQFDGTQYALPVIPSGSRYYRLIRLR